MYIHTTTIKYAKFWQRITALLLDLFIVIIPSFWLALYISAPIFLKFDTLKNASEDNFEFLYQVNKNFIYFMLISIAIASCFLTIFSFSRWQATPGKKIVGIRLVTTDGSILKFWPIFCRYASLPLFILMEQIFQRRENYARLEQFHKANPPPKIADLMQMPITQISEITSLVIIVTISFWYLRIIFTSEKTAFHDLLFNTRVVQNETSDVAPQNINQ